MMLVFLSMVSWGWDPAQERRCRLLRTFSGHPLFTPLVVITAR